MQNRTDDNVFFTLTHKGLLQFGIYVLGLELRKGGMCDGVAHAAMVGVLQQKVDNFDALCTDITRLYIEFMEKLDLTQIELDEFDAYIETDECKKLAAGLSPLAELKNAFHHADERDRMKLVSDYSEKMFDQLVARTKNRIDYKMLEFINQPEVRKIENEADQLYYLTTLIYHANAGMAEDDMLQQVLHEINFRLEHTAQTPKDSGGIAAHPVIYDACDQQSLARFFDTMKDNLLQQHDNPVSFLIAGAHTSGAGTHRITIGFDPAQKQWLFIDANERPTTKIPLAQTNILAEKIMHVFQHNNHALLTLRAYGFANDKPFANWVLQCEKAILADFSSHPEKCNLVDSRGCTLLWSTICDGSDKWFNCLLSAGADPFSKQYKEQSLLETAMIFGRTEMVTQLIQRGADVNARNKTGMSMLSVALFQLTRTGSLKVIAALLDAGAQPNACDESGLSTFMHQCALVVKDPNIIRALFKLLINHGGDIHTTSRMSVTPADFIAERFPALLCELVDYQAKHYLHAIEKGIRETAWHKKIFLNGKNIEIDGETVKVPEYVKKQWEIIQSVRAGDMSFHHAENIIRGIDDARNAATFTRLFSPSADAKPSNLSASQRLEKK